MDGVFSIAGCCFGRRFVASYCSAVGSKEYFCLLNWVSCWFFGLFLRDEVKCANNVTLFCGDWLGVSQAIPLSTLQKMWVWECWVRSFFYWDNDLRHGQDVSSKFMCDCLVSFREPCHTHPITNVVRRMVSRPAGILGAKQTLCHLPWKVGDY